MIKKSFLNIHDTMMKRILITAMCSSLCCWNSFATNLQTAVDKIIHQIDPNINMGIKVLDLNTGETLYQRNTNRLFIPASNMKLFSDAAALLALGPEYRFKNTLSTDATTLENGVLHGSIYLYLPGDPSFTQHDLNTLFARLTQLKIKQIQGDVIVVSDHQHVDTYPPGWVLKDLAYSYGAPLAPLILDENRVTITVNPAYQVGDKALIEYSAPMGSLSVDNQVHTANKTKGCGIDFRIDGNSHLTVKGCIGVGQWAVQQRLAMRTPLPYAEEVIKIGLNHANIQLNGHVRLGEKPIGALVIASHASKPITQILADTLKPSDNLYAESLFLHTAAKLNGAPLNWQPAGLLLKKFLEAQTGVNMQQAVLVDGSGLSRQDRLTIEQTVGLLKFLHERFGLAYEYIAALPIAGQDGTLQKRLRKSYQIGMVRAKTGSMTGVLSLSGYLYTANEHTLAFSIFINTLAGTKPNISGRYRSLIDALCDFFLRQKPDNVIVHGSQNSTQHVAFQNQPTQAQKNRAQQAKWRKLEYLLKQALHNEPVNILFRNDQLVLLDKGANMIKIWSVLQGLNKKSAFAVCLESSEAPHNNRNMPQLLWVKTPNQANNGTAATRIWIIQEAVS